MVQKLLKTSIIVLLIGVNAFSTYSQNEGDVFISVLVKKTSTDKPVDLDPDIWRGLKGVQEIVTPNELQYIYGNASDVKSAKKILKEVTKAGYEDASIVGIEHNQTIGAERAEGILKGEITSTGPGEEQIQEIVAEADYIPGGISSNAQTDSDPLEELAKEIKEETTSSTGDQSSLTPEEQNSAKLKTTMTVVDDAAMAAAAEEDNRSSGEKNSELFDYHEKHMIKIEEAKVAEDEKKAEARRVRQAKIAEITKGALAGDQDELAEGSGFTTTEGGKSNSREIFPVVGIGLGALVYYGDVSRWGKEAIQSGQFANNHSTPINGLSRSNLGINISITQRLGDMFGAGLDFTYGKLSGSLRDAEHSSKNINFQSSLMAIDAQFIVHGDNNMSSKREQTRVTAYALFGIGYVMGNVKYDMKGGTGDQYHYWTGVDTILNDGDGKIHTVEEGTPGDRSDGEVVNWDYKFESNRGSFGGVSIPLGLGAKFKVTNMMDCNIYGKFHFTLTDGLDGQNEGGADKFFYSGFSFNYKIGRGTGTRSKEESDDLDDIFYTMDSDGDGVRDSKDNCPDTYLGEAVDKKGCPINKREEEDVYEYSTAAVSSNEEYDHDANEAEHEAHEAEEEKKSEEEAKKAAEPQTSLLDHTGSGKGETADESNEGKDEVEFRIQIGSDTKKKELTPANFKGLKDVEAYKQWETYKYVVGHCKSIAEALKLQTEVRKIYPNAFAIAFKNGERTTFTEAKRILELNK
ncbi:MAG: SPOR domain-containing protein [Flavobacteriales bacterium]|nr:SPOR domain-containing protein [Flavobacteriales bacterium]